MDKEAQKTLFEENSPEPTMELVMKNIYSSCDPHNLNEVPTSELIKFIRPYMEEDLSALETLKSMLDPHDKDVNVDSEQFYNVMNEWAQKITSHSEENSDGDFNRTPSQLNNIDDKLLPYTQSTPRASFGQKLLSCQDLLNLSNVSNYNLSPSKQTKDNSIVGHERTVLEEEIKQLQYELTKVLGEMSMLKTQLTCTEEQNENLHDELGKLKTRLHSENQVNGHIQENKNCMEDMKEEITLGKCRIEELNKKLLLYEKENSHLNMYVRKLEKENSDLEDRCVQISKTEQSLKRQLIDVKTDLDEKENELSAALKISEELRLKLLEKNNEVDQLLSENELLDYKKQGLEKMISSRRYSMSSHYNTCLDEMNSFLSRGSTIPIYSSPFKHQPYSYNNAVNPSLIKTVLSPISPNPKDPTSKMFYNVLQNSTPKGSNGLGMRKAFSLNAMATRSMPNIFCSDRCNVLQDQGADSDVVPDSVPPDLNFSNYESLQVELFQVDPQFDHKVKNGTSDEYEEEIYSLNTQVESLQRKLLELEKENKILSIANKTNGEKLIDMNEKMDKILLEKNFLEEDISKNQENKTETNRIIKDLEYKLEHLQDEYNILKSEFSIKEADFKKKCDFESAYKSLEIEYGRKITLLDELKRQCEESKNRILNLTNRNKNLEQSLKETKLQLQETKDLHTNSLNIEQTTNKVQEYDLQKSNNELQSKIVKLEKELQDKIKQLVQLKEIIKKEEDIKNMMWKDNQDLTSTLNLLTEDHQNSLKEIGEFDNIKKELKEEYNALLSKHNEEIKKNQELCHQLSLHKKQYTDLNSKYQEISSKHHEEMARNLKFREEFSYLKNEIEDIRENHKKYKEELNKSLIDYQDSLHQLSSKLKDLEFENNFLKTDLNIEKQKLSKKRDLEYDDDGVRSETESEEDKNKRFFDIDVNTDSILLSSSHEKSAGQLKNISSNKKDVRIHHLTEKIENMKEYLLHEQSKNDILAQRIASKEKECLETKNRFCSEKSSLELVINELRDKLDRQEDYYKHLCNALNEKVKELSLKLSQLDGIHNNTLLDLSQKESLLQRNFETSEYNKATIERLSKNIQDFQIQQENVLGDLRSKEISLKNVTLENQSLKHFVQRLENQVLQQTYTLSYQETALRNFESDLSRKDEKLISMSSLLLERDDKIKQVTSDVKGYEKKVANILRQISARDDACIKLEQELKILKEKISATKDDEKNLEGINDISESNGELNSFKTHEAKVNGESNFDRISGFIDSLSECCSELNRAFTKFVEQWKCIIETHPKFKKLPTLRLCQSLEIGDVIPILVDNIKAIISLLDILSSDSQSTMENNKESQIPKQNSIEPKVIKKFTLRHAKPHVNRPVSPDSPGLEEEPHIIKEQPKYEHVSPDSQNPKPFFRLNEQGESSLQSDSTTPIPLLSFDLQIEDVFPHLSDDLLEQLGLHENSSMVKLSEEETEKIFTTFAIQIALHSKDIKERLQKQKEVCTERFRKCLYLLKDISFRLRDHKCIGATDPINPVFVMLEDVRFQMQEMRLTAGQLGALFCENRMTKCWNLVTNYVAIIRQKSEHLKEQSCPNRRLSVESKSEKREVLVERCQNCEKQNTIIKQDIQAKEFLRPGPYHSRCTRILTWLSFIPMLFFIGVILVHWQCKMDTEHKICPLDNFIQILYHNVGNPPY